MYKPNKLLICGSRTLLDKDFIFSNLNILLSSKLNTIEYVINGCASGVDSIVIDWCVNNNIKILKFIPDWKLYRNRAGYIRNQQMFDEGKPTHLIAFQDIRDNKNGTKGTTHMINICKRNNIPTRIFYYSIINIEI